MNSRTILMRLLLSCCLMLLGQFWVVLSHAENNQMNNRSQARVWKSKKVESKARGLLSEFKNRDNEECPENAHGPDDLEHRMEYENNHNNVICVCGGCINQCSDKNDEDDTVEHSSSNEETDRTAFLDFPYQSGRSGIACQDIHEGRKGFGFLHVSYAKINQVTGYDIVFQGRSESGKGISVHLTKLYEQMSDQSMDQLSIFRFGWFWNILIKPRIILDLDIGMRWIEKLKGMDAGLHTQLFTGNPFVLDFWISCTQVDKDAFFEWRSSIGWVISRIQLDVGYQYLRWDDELLSGPVIGTRVWF